jgi:hypothetical protein
VHSFSCTASDEEARAAKTRRKRLKDQSVFSLQILRVWVLRPATKRKTVIPGISKACFYWQIEDFFRQRGGIGCNETALKNTPFVAR